MKTILIIDDDVHIGNVLEETLTNEGYKVLRAYSGTEALFVLSQSEPDLVLLDLMLPGLSGEDLLPSIKGAPVIVMSAKTDIDDKINLLLNGAADYVTKPFHTKELLARIAIRLRDFDARKDSRTITFADIRLNADTRVVRIGDSDVRLTRTEFAILKTLMQNQTQIVSKSLLLDRMMEDTPDCTESSLKTHISHLRTKLLQITGKDYIETIWGIGYRMKEE